jgi:ubiquitin-conjugating enzyme E2 variant
VSPPCDTLSLSGVEHFVSSIVVLSAIVQVLSAWLVADALGGLFHWFIDHHASTKFWLTRAVVKDFREHHDDRLSMEKYSRWPSFILGVLGSLPLVIATFYLGFEWFAAVALTGAMLTQHAHYYAHTPKPPAWARLLQQLGLFVSPAAHERHHSDFFRSYGVLNGWSHGIVDLALGRRY